MCIIVDADRIGKFFSKQDNEDVAPIHKWLKKKLGVLIYSTGSKFADELQHKTQRQLLEYVNAGYAKLISASDFQHDEHRLQKNSAVKSNDCHVLALARAANVRILYTGDQNLMEDFKNKDLISKGKIYTGKQNQKKLLNNWRCPSAV